MDPVVEKESMLARGGSFWYRTISDGDKRIARTMNGLACLTRLNRQTQNAVSILLSGGYIRDNFITLRFKHSDINYFGTEKALQRRYNVPIGYSSVSIREANLKIAAGAFMEEREGNLIGDDNGTPIIFPKADEDAIVFPGNYRVRFSLRIDPDIFVEAIRDHADRILQHGVDFVSYFGYLYFRDNPIALFPDMQICAYSLVRRVPNLYSYTFRLDKVYGPIDRVVRYYRKDQSPRAFYLAAAQAGGLPVVREDSRISTIVPLGHGVSYFTTDGMRYDAPFRHNRLPHGFLLRKDYVIGGDELFKMYLPGEAIPASVKEIRTGTTLPVPDITIPNMMGEIGYSYGSDPSVQLYTLPGLRSEEKRTAYLKLLNEQVSIGSSGDDRTSSTQVIDNYIEWFRRNVWNGACIVVCFNEEAMSRDMMLRLDTFIRREVPLGCVLTTAKLGNIIAPGG